MFSYPLKNVCFLMVAFLLQSCLFSVTVSAWVLKEGVGLIVILWPVRFLGKTVASQNIPISESINWLLAQWLLLSLWQEQCFISLLPWMHY